MSSGCATHRRVLLRRHDERLRGNAGLCGAGTGRGSVGDRRVHPGAATQHERHGRRRAGGPPFGSRSSRPGEPVNVDTTFSPPVADIDRARSKALIAGVIGLVGVASDCSSIRDHFFRAWLVAYMLFLGISLGSLALMMIQHLSGGSGVSSAGSSRPPAACYRCWQSCSSGPSRYQYALSVVAPGPRRGRRGAASQVGVPQHNLLYRPRGDLLCGMVGNRDAAEQAGRVCRTRVTSPSTRASSA